MVDSWAASRSPQGRRKPDRQDDEARFLKSWLRNPLRTGAVAPSGPVLARKMASFVDPQSRGPIIELGPGTGPVTQALLDRGVDPSRLVLVEYERDFCRLLQERFPRATVVQGDAYALGRTLAGRLSEPAAAVVSSLPLVTRPEPVRTALVREAFGLMKPGAPFIQFTYAVVSPVPLKGADFSAEPSERVWRNMPPARVWVYRRALA
jgi:phosphatidylethanolamine/phosphatidyl-N-methylethanolamine N-methyltransferase